MSEERPLVSFVLKSPADALLRQAVAQALAAEPGVRGELFSRLMKEIHESMQQQPGERPWKYQEFTGTDGSWIFRGGTGRSIVVDPSGGIWRARSYEDFETGYEITEKDCRIVSLTPLYAQMKPYP